MRDSYNELIDKFSELNNNIKQREIVNEIQETLMLFHSLCKRLDVKNRIFIHEKMNALEDSNFSEDDFLDALYAYIISMKEAIGKYFELYN